METNMRIKFIRKSLKLSQAEFGKLICFGRDVIANIEGNRIEPKENHIIAICKEFGVNEEWLRTGSGEPFIEKDEDDELAEWVSNVLGDRDETIQKRTLKMLHQLDASDWAAIDALVKKGLQLLNDQNSKK